MKGVLKQIFTIVAIAFVFFVLLVIVTRGQAAAGGQFALEKTVVAGGGREKQSPGTGENGTTGQAVAGHFSTGGQFAIRSGFWTPESLVPSAAGVSVTGRVMTSDGRGIVNARLTLVSATGETHTVITATFGYFRFSEVQAGQTHVLTVSARRFSFAQPSMTIDLTDSVSDCNFIAQAP